MLLGAFVLSVRARRRPNEQLEVQYSSTGSEMTFVVPEGVFGIYARAVGGHGGWRGLVQEAGAAAEVTGNLSVTPGETLYVEVGGNGESGFSGYEPGGFNGGGAGVTPGGGASDIRRAPRKDGLAPDTRLIVAGGGGGKGDSSYVDNDQHGGNAGTYGAAESGGKFQVGYELGLTPELNFGGGGATRKAGGAGGAGECGGGTEGERGNGGEGGTGLGERETPGAGGGGGYFGGGGGGGGCKEGGAGGGGGSSLVPPGGTATIAPAGSAPTIRITYPAGGGQPSEESGPTGPTGPEGATGATGPTGSTGASGAEGPSGPTGVTGATGATGATGPPGATGVEGPTGGTGPTGPTATADMKHVYIAPSGGGRELGASA